MEIIIRNTEVGDLEQLPDLYKEGFGKDTNVDSMYKSFNNLLNNEDYLFYSSVLPDGEVLCQS